MYTKEEIEYLKQQQFHFHLGFEEAVNTRAILGLAIENLKPCERVDSVIAAGIKIDSQMITQIATHLLEMKENNHGK